MSTGTTLDPVTTIEVECWYEYAANAKEVLATGHRRIDKHDDPRWDDELMKAPFMGDPQGYLNVAVVTRVNGEPLKVQGIMGFSGHKNKCQGFMQEFDRLKTAKSKTPWDQERHFRDLIASAEEMRREGRMEEIKSLGNILKEALAPNKQVSAGSPVTKVA